MGEEMRDSHVLRCVQRSHILEIVDARLRCRNRSADAAYSGEPSGDPMC